MPTHTHTHTLRTGRRICLFSLPNFLIDEPAGCFFLQLCSVWPNDKKKKKKNPADPRTALHQKKKKTLQGFPYVCTPAIPEDSNFYWVKLKHKSSFVSEINRSQRLFLFSFLFSFFLHEVDAVRRRRRVYNCRNIRNETTTRWSLYVKYLEQMFSCRLWVVVSFLWCKLVFRLSLPGCKYHFGNSWWRLEECEQAVSISGKFLLDMNIKQIFPNWTWYQINVRSLFFFCPSRKPEHSPCHLELDVGHICSYGYLRVCVCVCVCACEGRGASVCSSLHKKKRNFMKTFGVASRLIRTVSGWMRRYGERNRKKKKRKYIYNSILCRIFIGLLCHWSHALHWPCPALSTMWSLYIVLYWWPVADLIVFSCQVHFSQ